MQRKWILRGMTLAVWMLAAGSAVFWGFRLMAAAAPDAAVTVAHSGARPGDFAADTAALARWLGAGTNAVAAAAPLPGAGSRFALTGVIAQRQRPGSGPVGVALISVDGKPARPYRVGERLEETYVLQSVGTGSVVLAPSLQAPGTLTLLLPKPVAGKGRDGLSGFMPNPGNVIASGIPPQVSLAPAPLNLSAMPAASQPR